MNFKEALSPFILSSDPVVSAVALKAEVYTDEYKKGNLSKDEYKELMTDLTVMKRIEETADALEQRTNLNSVINSLIAVASLA